MPVPPDFALRLSSDNGSVPRDLQEALVLTLDVHGGTLAERRGDERGAPMPLSLDAAAVATLYDDLVALGLFSTAWAMPEGPITPGGPNVWVTATRGGTEVTIPSIVRGAQREGQEAIVRRVETAVGRSLRR